MHRLRWWRGGSSMAAAGQLALYGHEHRQPSAILPGRQHRQLTHLAPVWCALGQLLQGNACIQFNLGYSLQNRTGVKGNYKEVVNYPVRLYRISVIHNFRHLFETLIQNMKRRLWSFFGLARLKEVMSSIKEDFRREKSDQNHI
ncbi:hypothetical protein EJB05_54031, partial [Eragrostis curvula]